MEGVVTLTFRRCRQDRPLHRGLIMVMVTAALLLLPLGLRLPTTPTLILCISPTKVADKDARG